MYMYRMPGVEINTRHVMHSISIARFIAKLQAIRVVRL